MDPDPDPGGSNIYGFDGTGSATLNRKNLYDNVEMLKLNV
jgi:hypothetical protein